MEPDARLTKDYDEDEEESRTDILDELDDLVLNILICDWNSCSGFPNNYFFINYIYTPDTR